ncbi:MAG: hypothetical protein C9356_04950 [Oleiphilus sp.]|nr:MAG: hypothetical protein C9356_04950 [Oleiphilus sp.]
MSQFTEPVNVVCLKWGSLYGPEYVNILYRMVERNLSRPFRFICFTEDPEGLDAGVEHWPLPEFEEPPWEYARVCSAWRKLALFKPGLAKMQGRVLFLDLDVVIVGPLDDFFAFGGTVAMIENWYQPGQQVGQASVMCFDAGGPRALLERYQADPLSVLKRYPTEQAYISGALGEDCYFFPDAWCRSYKKHCMPQGMHKFFGSENHLPEGARILVFHGRPNPPDAIVGQWGKDFPWYKRWYKKIYPSPWLKTYWQ